MTKFEVVIRRIVREDTIVHVEAENEKEALRKAYLAAPNVDQKDWDVYDCEYWHDSDGIKKDEEG